MKAGILRTRPRDRPVGRGGGGVAHPLLLRGPPATFLVEAAALLAEAAAAGTDAERPAQSADELGRLPCHPSRGLAASGNGFSKSTP